MNKQEEILKEAFREFYTQQDKSSKGKDFEETWQEMNEDKEFGQHMIRTIYSAMDKYHDSFKRKKKQ